MVFPGQLQQSAFDDRVEFFEHKHFVQALEKGEREFVREGKGRRDLEHFRLRAAERIHEIGVAHAAGGDAFAARARDSIARITRERGAERGVARLNLLVVEVGGARENDPARNLLQSRPGYAQSVRPQHQRPRTRGRRG